LHLEPLELLACETGVQTRRPTGGTLAGAETPAGTAPLGRPWRGIFFDCSRRVPTHATGTARSGTQFVSRMLRLRRCRRPPLGHRPMLVRAEPLRRPPRRGSPSTGGVRVSVRLSENLTARPVVFGLQSNRCWSIASTIHLAPPRATAGGVVLPMQCCSWGGSSGDDRSQRAPRSTGVEPTASAPAASDWVTCSACAAWSR
jgi:hypothetical protein